MSKGEMSLAACEGIFLTSLQNVFSTSVGVAFAYPILAQIIDIKNQKILIECDRVLRFGKAKHGSAGFADLGSKKIQFQFRLNKIAIMNSRLTFLSALIGVGAFSMLIFSSIEQSLCIDKSTSVIICVILSLPFVVGTLHLLHWADVYVSLSAAISYYRGDLKKNTR